MDFAILKLYAALLVREVDNDIASLLTDPAVAPAFELAAPALNRSLTPWTEDRALAAAEEFARLFLLPGGVPPFGSVWLPAPAHWQDIERTVAEVRQDLGLTSAPDAWGGRLPTDHLAVLLDLAAECGRTDPVCAAAFLRTTVHPWHEGFAAALIEAARHPVYQALGGLLLSGIGLRTTFG